MPVLISSSKLSIPGLIGVICFGIFSFICIWRLFILRNFSDSSRIFYYKVIFHFLLLFNGLLELSFYMTMMLSKGTTVFGYTLHICGLFCNVAAFLSMIYTWSNILQTKKQKQKSKILLIGMIGINFITSLITIIFLISSGSFSKFTEGIWNYYLLVIFINGISLLSVSMNLLIYGRTLRQKLLIKSFTNKFWTQRKLRMLIRINLILGICSICFFVRVACITLDTIDRLSPESSLVSNFPSVVWYLFSSWIPTIIPGLILLYTQKVSRSLPTLQSQHQSNLKFNSSSNSVHESAEPLMIKTEEDTIPNSILPTLNNIWSGNDDEDDDDDDIDYTYADSYLEWDDETGELDNRTTGFSDFS